MEIDGHTFFFSVAIGVIIVMLLVELVHDGVRSVVREVIQEEYLVFSASKAIAQPPHVVVVPSPAQPPEVVAAATS